MIGRIYWNALYGAFIFPSFIFLDFPVYFKVVIMTLYVLVLAFFCFCITVYADRFVNKVSWKTLLVTSVLPSKFDDQTCLSTEFIMLKHKFLCSGQGARTGDLPCDALHSWNRHQTEFHRLSDAQQWAQANVVHLFTPFRLFNNGTDWGEFLVRTSYQFGEWRNKVS